MAWSPDGRLLVSASEDSTVRVWDLENAVPHSVFAGHSGWVSSVAWSPDGRTIASGGADTIVRLWDFKSRHHIRVLGGHAGDISSVVWSRDGSTLASASNDRSVRVWDASTGRTAVLEGHTARVKSVSFSADGGLLASKSGDGSVRLWRCDTWEPVAVLDEPASGRRSSGLAFHPGAPVLASLGQGDRRVRVWDLDLGVLLGAPTMSQVVQYSNAKIVLVGESGVGKSGLAFALAGHAFRPTESTHGRRVLMFDSSRVDLGDCRTEVRESLLWDLAGEPGYRLIHQLHLNEVAVALVVIDATTETDPFAGVRSGTVRSRQAQRLRSESAPGLPSSWSWLVSTVRRRASPRRGSKHSSAN